MLYAPYHSRAYYQEIVVLARRLALVAVDTQLFLLQSDKPIAYALLCALCLYIHVLVKPFAHTEVNTYETSSLFALVRCVTALKYIVLFLNTKASFFLFWFPL